MKYIVTLNGNEYEVEVEKGVATEVFLGQTMFAAPTAAPTITLDVEANAMTPVPVAEKAAASGNGTPVEAPMAGNIVQAKCEEGKAVKQGDVLFILEAMKMENEITAPQDGTIDSVLVSKGNAVDTGAVLCTIV
ncbi:MAG: biotin/lipoyl-containing protein [Bacillota bacterium]